MSDLPNRPRINDRDRERVEALGLNREHFRADTASGVSMAEPTPTYVKNYVGVPPVDRTVQVTYLFVGGCADGERRKVDRAAVEGGQVLRVDAAIATPSGRMAGDDFPCVPVSTSYYLPVMIGGGRFIFVLYGLSLVDVVTRLEQGCRR